jgi:hypothetical protein
MNLQFSSGHVQHRKTFFSLFSLLRAIGSLACTAPPHTQDGIARQCLLIGFEPQKQSDAGHRGISFRKMRRFFALRDNPP